MYYVLSKEPAHSNVTVKPWHCLYCFSVLHSLKTFWNSFLHDMHSEWSSLVF